MIKFDKKVKQQLPQMRWLLFVVFLVVLGSCARFNVYYNANKAYKDAEQIREDREKLGEEVAEPTGNQVQLYQQAVKKCQILMEDYPGSGLTDEALFIMAKSYHRIASYRMSISKFELLFTNFPANNNEEEAFYLQAMNHLLIGDVGGSNSYLTKLRNRYPESEYSAEASRVSGDNSFALEKWEEARASYEEYLELSSDSEQLLKTSIKLAECYWEIGEYEAAQEIAHSIIDSDARPAEVFTAKLLLGRCFVKLGHYEEVDQMLSSLHDEAEVHQAGGFVLLLEAENRAAQGDWDGAAPMLENMPQEWASGDVGIRGAELLGDIYFEQWKLEEAVEKYRLASRSGNLLDNPDRTKLRKDVLERYMTATRRLDTASSDQVPALKLIQANAMLFGMGRSDLALELYREVAAADSIDASSAVRGLYGVAVLQRDFLDQPDSLAVTIDELFEKYPESPQAYMLLQNNSGNLYGFFSEEKADSVLIRNSLIASLSDSLAAVADSMLALPPDQRPELWRPSESVVIANLDAKQSAEMDSVLIEEPLIIEQAAAVEDTAIAIIGNEKCLPAGKLQEITADIAPGSELWVKLAKNGTTFIFPGSGWLTGSVRTHFDEGETELKPGQLSISIDGAPADVLTFIFEPSEKAFYGDDRSGVPSQAVQFELPLAEGYHLIKLSGDILFVDLYSSIDQIAVKETKAMKKEKQKQANKKYRGL